MCDEIVQGRTDEEGDTEIVVARHASGARERGRKAFDVERVAKFGWEGAAFSEFVDQPVSYIVSIFTVYHFIAGGVDLVNEDAVPFVG